MRIAERQAERAAGVFREQRGRLDEECSRQSQLCEYQHEYHRRQTEVGAKGLSAGAFKNTQLFITQLQHASSSATDQVREARAVCERHHQAWLSARTRSHVLQNIAERYASRERQQRQTREQLESDDRAGVWVRPKR